MADDEHRAGERLLIHNRPPDKTPTRSRANKIMIANEAYLGRSRTLPTACRADLPRGQRAERHAITIVRQLESPFPPALFRYYADLIPRDPLTPLAAGGGDGAAVGGALSDAPD